MKELEEIKFMLEDGLGNFDDTMNIDDIKDIYDMVKSMIDKGIENSLKEQGIL